MSIVTETLLLWLICNRLAFSRNVTILCFVILFLDKYGIAMARRVYIKSRTPKAAK